MKSLELFNFILDNAKNIEQDIRNQIYNSLVSNSRNEKLQEFIKESIEHFNFNLVERNFLNQLQEVKEELIIFTSSPSKDIDDYNSFSNNLINRLRRIEANVLISLDDDLINLANQIAKRYELGDGLREELQNNLMKKRENIINKILAYNKTIVDALVKITPQLVNEMKQLSNNIKEQHQDKQKDSYVPDQNHFINKVENNNSIKSEQLLNTLITTSKKQYNELQRRLSYLRYESYRASRIIVEIGELRRTILQLETFIDNLSRENVQDLINKYSKIEDLNEMGNFIISKEVSRLESVNNLTKENIAQFSKFVKTNYSEYSLPSLNIEPLHNKIINSSSLKDLLQGKAVIEKFLGTFDYDTNKKLQEEYLILIDKIIMLSTSKTKNNNPNPTTGKEEVIGNSQDDIMSLINSNRYYSILQAIPMVKAGKYRFFIIYGLNEVINRWRQKDALAKTYEDKQKSYQELTIIFDNFKDYIPLEIVDMLRSNLENMKTYLQEHRPELSSTRYSNEQKDEHTSSMKM